MKNRTIFALGYFDGVHLGHQALLSACEEAAAEAGTLCGAVTFSGHPQQILTGGAVRLINTQADREALLRQSVDAVLTLPFTEQLKNMPWQDFCQMLIREHGAAGFVCGSDFRFGKGGEGTAQSLSAFCKAAGLSCVVVPQQTLQGIRVSSTHIRTLLEQGNMEEAARFLGHPHVLSGTVVQGNQLGRTIGVPTANVAYPPELVQLPRGVYACRVTVEGKTYASVTNVGYRPTVNGQGVNVENWLQGFSGDLYGKTVRIAFYAYLRPEHKFSDLSALKKQIEKDKFTVENCMGNL